MLASEVLNADLMVIVKLLSTPAMRADVMGTVHCLLTSMQQHWQ